MRRPGSPPHPDALRRFLAAPRPPGGTPLADLRLLAVDMETTGLSPDDDHILSVGWVPVDGTEIRLGGAGHVLVAAGVPVGASATIHGLTDDAVAGGVPLAAAMTALLDALGSRVLLVHFAAIETRFGDAACRRLWGARFRPPVVDTMVLQHRLVGERGGASALRLFNAREGFGLPRYRAHDALLDALACAELYLAQAAELGCRRFRDVRG